MDRKIILFAAWNMICKPNNKGGLGILDLKLQNRALLLKYLDKLYNNRDLPWVKLFWETHYTNSVPHGTNQIRGGQFQN
jgi:hypothetical protein